MYFNFKKLISYYIIFETNKYIDIKDYMSG